MFVVTCCITKHAANIDFLHITLQAKKAGPILGHSGFQIRQIYCIMKILMSQASQAPIPGEKMFHFHSAFL